MLTSATPVVGKRGFSFASGYFWPLLFNKDGETNRVEPVNVLVRQDNSANLIGLNLSGTFLEHKTDVKNREWAQKSEASGRNFAAKMLRQDWKQSLLAEKR
jgi:hypothetical protein